MQDKEDHTMRWIHSTRLGILVGVSIAITAALSGLVRADEPASPPAAKAADSELRVRTAHVREVQLGLLAAAKNNPVAEDHYLNAIKINPMSEEAHYHLGMYYQQTGRYDKAVVSYDNILRINPEHFDALFNLGVVHNRFLENPQGIFSGPFLHFS